MIAKNKWNGKLYKIVNIGEKDVTLQREDGSVFTIQKSEYFFSYFEKNT